MTRTTARLTGLAGALVAGTLLLAGCADDSSNAAGHGSMMSDGSSSASSSTSAEADHNDADVAFASGMIPHHESAITMAQMAQAQAADPRVKDLAARIEAAQAPEIETMSGWLADWGAAASGSATDDGMGGMDHGGMSGMGKEGEMSSGASSQMAMPGMMSDTQMQQLTDATGADFDRLFLQLMIMHHQGAINMADTEIAQGSNPAALALAESIKTSQTAEITEMQQLLTTL
jgi:uncharacterized protein (DUF305 family)